jgi:hypothetical protein
MKSFSSEKRSLQQQKYKFPATAKFTVGHMLRRSPA